jgi:hypothetical protein
MWKSPKIFNMTLISGEIEKEDIDKEWAGPRFFCKR